MPDRRGSFLLIEDDLLLGESLKEYLEMRGFSVIWIKEGFREIEHLVDFSCFHGIILDLILPERSGEEILRIIRSKTISVPVLVLTAKGGMDTKKACFLGGADDYLVKPFEMEELLLRLNALIRRGGTLGCYIIGDAILDEGKGMISRDGKEIKISKRAWNLLIYLLKNRGRIVNKEELLRNVWHDAHVTEETLRAYIKELRKIFPRSFETYKGRGYRLV
ncbi:MAG: response regulator transcription factor [Syntrophobacterales bacterium]|nr:response regulator transcription factor [Syntrophobacterales bacterium]